jgi:hypothetical protein
MHRPIVLFLHRNALRCAVVALAVLLPALGQSEGARKRLDCQIVRVCDAGGACSAGTGKIVFAMEPIELETAGAGRYTLTYAGTEAEMKAESDAGPFLWSVGRERHALIASSETEWLWHELAFDPGPQATIRFLECAFEQ